MKRFFISCMLMAFTVSCEILDDDPDRHAAGGVYVSPAEVAEVLSGLPLGQDQMREVFTAVTASAVNGYDEEYTMSDLFVSPGSGVGDDRGQETRSAVKGVPLRDMIETHLKSALPVRSSCPIPDPDAWLDYVAKSDMQIYWPFSESWDGVSLPVITSFFSVYIQISSAFSSFFAISTSPICSSSITQALSIEQGSA